MFIVVTSCQKCLSFASLETRPSHGGGGSGKLAYIWDIASPKR